MISMDIVTYADSLTFLVAIGRIEHRKSRRVEAKAKGGHIT